MHYINQAVWASVVACTVLTAVSGTAQTALEAPPWESTVSHTYKFPTDSITPEADESQNPFGTPTARINLGPYSDGWQSPDPTLPIPQTSGKPGSGAWDLGSSGEIVISVPIGDRALAEDFIAYRVRLSVTVTAYGKMVAMPGLEVPHHALNCLNYETKHAFDDALLGSWSNCVWNATLSGVMTNEITLVITADPQWGSIIDEVEIFALAEEVDKLYSAMGVPIEWYQQNGLEPEEGQNWNDLDFGDADDDGALNWQEYYAGTDPTNAQSRLRITKVVAATPLEPARLEWFGGNTGSQAPYIIESATDLWEPVWEPVGTQERGETSIHVWEGTDMIYQPFRVFRIKAPNDILCPK